MGEAQWGGVLSELNQPTFQLAGQKIAVSFRPATDEDETKLESQIPDTIETEADLPSVISIDGIQMIGEITLDGEVVAETEALQLGDTLLSRFGYSIPEHGWRYKQNSWVVGEYHALGIDLHGLSSQQLEDLQTQLSQVQTNIETESFTDLNKHDLVGNMLQATVMSYFAMTAANERLSALPANIIHHRMPSFGTFSTKLNVATLFGTPRSISAAGLAMDIDQIQNSAESQNNCYQDWLNFQKNWSVMSSAFEHLVPEQMFSTADSPVEGVSTVKALNIAMTQGQKIYTLTQDTADELNNITIDTLARAEIETALGLGYEVTVHESPIELNGWIGSGYSIIDSEMGIGAWKISGGESGVFSKIKLKT